MIFKKLANILGLQHPSDEEIFFTTRRAVLYSRILALTGLAVLLTLIKDIIDQGVAPVPMAIFILFLVILTAVILNRIGKHEASKVLFLLLMNIIIALLCSVIPKERFAFIFFFPMIIMAYVIFEDTEKPWRVLFITLPSVILMTLVLTDFKLFWDFQLSVSGLGQRNFIINVIVTILIILLCVDFLVRTNRKSEEVLRNQAADIEKKNKQLQKINSELDRFVYSASHDLRAPLLSIQGLSKVAIAESESEGDKKYFELIHERVIKLDEFIREIIEYSKNARTDLRIEKFQPESLVNEVIENLKYLPDAESISFSVQNSVPEMIADKGRVKIIVTNIVANAIKYHNPRCENQLIGISIDQENEQYIIKIEDNGMGISGESKGRIFEMFFRASEKSSGSGLGLYIVKEMVHRLGGFIHVESILGQGSSFIVNFPIQKEE